MHMAAARDFTHNAEIGADTYSTLARAGTSWPPTGVNGSTPHTASTARGSTPTGALSAQLIPGIDQASPVTGTVRSTTTMLTSVERLESGIHDGIPTERRGAGLGHATVNGTVLVPDRSKTVWRPAELLASASPERVNGSVSNAFSPPTAKSQECRGSVSGHKRTATGEFKSSSNIITSGHSSVNHTTRPRSKTTSAVDPSGRIAELSVQLRARLSYAASKVERGWPPRDTSSKRAVLFHQSRSPVSTEREGVMLGDGRLQTVPEAHPMRPPPDDRPPSFNTPPSLHSQGASTQLHPANPYDGTRIHPMSLSPRKTLTPPPFAAHMPKLAPPVDIVARSHSARRRRPNPNQMSPEVRPSELYPRHRRHHSQHEYTSSHPAPASQIVLVPGTPPLRPTSHPASARSVTTMDNKYLKPRTNSQNALMEQDAIETLLFMSSPENSGYHPSPQRHSNTASVVTNNDAGPLDDHRSGGALNSGRSSQQFTSQESYHDLRRVRPEPTISSQMASLEAHAGDEIDRLLDQMDDPDSEDERRYSTFRVNQFSPNVFPGNRAGNGSSFRGHGT